MRNEKKKLKVVNQRSKDISSVTWCAAHICVAVTRFEIKPAAQWDAYLMIKC